MSAADLEAAACEAARRGGEVLRRAFQRGIALRVERKGPRDFVTKVDRQAEAEVVAYLRKRFPKHAILAEESAADTEPGRLRWVVDPLDGTTNFVHGVPIFAVSIALEDDEGPLVAAVYDPMRDELFRAVRGGGARLGRRPIRCSRRRRMDVALLATGFPFRKLRGLRNYLRTLERFVRLAAGIRRAGSAALDLAYTACGRYDGFWEFGLSRWDVAAGALLVREAGGRVTDPRGDTRAWLASGDVVAAGPSLHAAMLRITRAARRTRPLRLR